MYISGVELENFRNYESLALSFDPSLNLILGKNAQGKTNLLESLYIMGLGKSFRTSKDKEMIAFGKDYAKASCRVEREDGQTGIQIVYQKDGKILRVDGVALARSVDLLGYVYLVVFSPEDLRIVKDGTESRRRFLDRELCQIKPVYFKNLGSYKKVLRQRNALLRQREVDPNLFSAFDEALSDYGLRIADERRSFTEKLHEISRDIHARISAGEERLSITYETKVGNEKASWEERKEGYLNRLEKDLEKDRLLGYTSFGPHKDDLKIEVNGADIRRFGSQGQQRTAALSMKLAEIELIKQETGKDPVLLLDDVLSELDQTRQQDLIEAMKEEQVFITATEIEEDLIAKLPRGRRFLVENGAVKSLT